MFKLQDRANGIISSLNKDLMKLETKSKDALSTFKETVDDMDKINLKIEERITLADLQIESLSTLKSTLIQNKSSNEKIRNKILEFLG